MTDEMKKQWDALKAEKARQDRELAQIEAQLKELGNVGLVIPQSFFEDFERLCTTRSAAQVRVVSFSHFRA